MTRSKIKNVLGDAAKDLVKSNYPLSGYRTKHKFDVVVANGQPYFAAQGISFEVRVKEDIQNSIAWKIADVLEKTRRRVTGKIPIAEFIG
jgi:hypothetical protein